MICGAVAGSGDARVLRVAAMSAVLFLLYVSRDWRKLLLVDGGPPVLSRMR
jgi:hypothetical protein